MNRNVIHRIRNATLALVALGVLACLPAKATLRAEVFSMSVSESVDYLLANNRDYQKALADLEQARLRVMETGSSALPQVDLGYTATRLGNTEGISLSDSLSMTPASNTYSYSLGATQLLFSGQVFYAIGAARSYREVAEAQLRSTRAGLIRSFLEQYAQVQLLRELVDLNEEVVAQARARYEDATLLHEIGSLSRYDLLRNEVEYMNSIPALREAENGLDYAESSLRLMLNLPSGTRLEIHGFDLQDEVLTRFSAEAGETQGHGELTADWLPDLQKRALQQRPEMRITQQSVEGYKRGLRSYQAELLPTVAAFYNLERARPGDMFGISDEWHNSWNAGINVSLPIFTGLGRYARIKSAKQDLRKAGEDKSMMEDQIRIEVEFIGRELERRLLDYAAWERNAEAAEEGLRIARMRRDGGAGSEIELRDARTAMKAARANLAQARYDLITARINFLHALGELDGVEILTTN